MSGFVDRITAVLREHRPTTRRIKHPWRKGILLNIWACTGCDWGDEDTTEDAHAVHVAEQVAAELRLHEEWTLHCFAGSVDTYRSRAAAEARWGDREALKIRGDGPLAVRYVSRWERAE